MALPLAVLAVESLLAVAFSRPGVTFPIASIIALAFTSTAWPKETRRAGETLSGDAVTTVGAAADILAVGPIGSSSASMETFGALKRTGMETLG